MCDSVLKHTIVPVWRVTGKERFRVFGYWYDCGGYQFFENLLFGNYLSDLIADWQWWSPSDSIPKLLKQNYYINKWGPSRGGAVFPVVWCMLFIIWKLQPTRTPFPIIMDIKVWKCSSRKLLENLNVDWHKVLDIKKESRFCAKRLKFALHLHICIVSYAPLFLLPIVNI